MLAAVHGNLACVAALLRHGASLFAMNERGNTVVQLLQLALDHGGDTVVWLPRIETSTSLMSPNIISGNPFVETKEGVCQSPALFPDDEPQHDLDYKHDDQQSAAHTLVSLRTDTPSPSPSPLTSPVSHQLSPVSPFTPPSSGPSSGGTSTRTRAARRTRSVGARTDRRTPAINRSRRAGPAGPSDSIQRHGRDRTASTVTSSSYPNISTQGFKPALGKARQRNESFETARVVCHLVLLRVMAAMYGVNVVQRSRDLLSDHVRALDGLPAPASSLTAPDPSIQDLLRSVTDMGPGVVAADMMPPGSGSDVHRDFHTPSVVHQPSRIGRLTASPFSSSPRRKLVETSGSPAPSLLGVPVPVDHHRAFPSARAELEGEPDSASAAAAASMLFAMAGNASDTGGTTTSTEGNAGAVDTSVASVDGITHPVSVATQVSVSPYRFVA